jgi:hypothetical protein
MSLGKFWKRYHEYFDEHDGSLPEVRLSGIQAPHLSAVFDRLRGAASRLSESTFWDPRLEQDFLVASVPNAALLVASSAVPSFHVVLQGVRVGGIRVPDIGVFVFPDQVALDYQPGSEWNETALEAFLELVRQASLEAPEAVVETEPEIEEEYRREFALEFAQYCDRVAAT